MLGDCFEEVMGALRSACVRHYGEWLVTVGVFGSVARGWMDLRSGSAVSAPAAYAEMARGTGI